VVPAGGRCASACASIIFISGKYRTVEDGGFLGQHSCSRDGRPSQQCNEFLAEHAITKGVSHGSIAAFTTYMRPHDMLWFSRSEADCWGITHYPFSEESGFEKSEPCVIENIVGRKPPAQSAWRIDFKLDGYRAFLRPASDSERELELGLYCDERAPGAMFLTMDITGPSYRVQDAVISASFMAGPIRYVDAPFSVSQISPEVSQVTMKIEKRDVIDLLTKVSKMTVELGVTKPYDTISATTYLSNSRKALLFTANNCINRKESRTR
jgi:hypothetical protein